MRILLVLVVPIVLVLAFLLLRGRRRVAARERVQEAPFPGAWRATLERNLPLYRRLPPEERERLHGHVQVFLAEKRFEGCGGLEMTDEIRVTVAGQACILLLNLEHADYYARLRSILVYPGATMPVRAAEHGHGTLAAGEQAVLGESWEHGTVILSWDGVRSGARTPGDGKNLVFHEFAHQLDQEDGEADGVPELDGFSAYLTWGRVMQEHYAGLQRAAEAGRRTLLDDYGATNPAEFFAVATECFFEKPAQLKRKHPALYDELAAYYGVDPTAWLSTPAS